MFNFLRRPSDPDDGDSPEPRPEPRGERPPPAQGPSPASTVSPLVARTTPGPPAAPAPPPPAPPPAEPAVIIRANPTPVPRPAPPPSEEPAGRAPAASGASVAPSTSAASVGDGPALLVVEDNDDTRMLLERILRSTYAVTAVADARAALQAMNDHRFSGLVLDINLGGRETGADVLRIARSLPDHDGVFAIALTAYALPGDRERLLEAGFNEYISKPFTRQSLMETLKAGVPA